LQSGTGPLNTDSLFYTQWATLSVLTNSFYKISYTAPDVVSFKDLDPENIMA
jgi:hypothetical protein